ncbi:MAG: hypothetical protein PUP93_27370 [Rhizonema sp. NSF051]|nr:hypothetical protein [Rhizonema sp. NSF051]
MKLDARGAVMAAKKYFDEIQELIGSTLQDILLEELELSEDKNFWLITLGFNRPVLKTKNPLFPELVASPEYKREYKLFKIDSETGEVQSMKIRQV